MKQSIIVLIFALLLIPKLNFSQISPAVKERVQLAQLSQLKRGFL
jgi:hypothetical protein